MMKSFNNKILALIAINIASLILFLILLKNVFKGGFFITLDQYIYSYLNMHHSAFIDSLMILITSLTDTLPYAISSLILLIAFIKRKETRIAFLLLTGILGGLALKLLIKWLVARQRPELGLISAAGSSFPSGHATMTLILVVILCIVLNQSKISKKIKVIGCVLLGLFTVVTGFSRIYLNLHWSSDVIGGFALAGFWMTIVHFLFISRKEFNKKPTMNMM